jgi:hypothetical protein
MQKCCLAVVLARNPAAAAVPCRQVGIKWHLIAANPGEPAANGYLSLVPAKYAAVCTETVQNS